MRASLLLAAALTACTSSYVTPTAAREDWHEPGRHDYVKDPTLDLVHPTGGWFPGEGYGGPANLRERVAEAGIATVLAALVGGWGALVALAGTFDETAPWR